MHRSSTMLLVVASVLVALIQLPAADAACVAAETPLQTCTSEPALSVSVGAGHACALLADGNVTCWGSNAIGQSTGYNGGDAVAISAGGATSCALLQSRNVRCWGNNNFGNGAPYDGGDATALAVGSHHTCLLVSGGNAFCYGMGNFGEATPRPGPFVAIAVGLDHTCAIRQGGTPECWGRNDQGQAPPILPFPDATSLDLGASHSCFLFADQNVACVGSNLYGQSSGYFGGDATALGAAQAHSCALTAIGTVRCWGDNALGQSIGYSGGNAVGVALGGSTSCALLASGNVRCWGSNATGQAAGYTATNVEFCPAYNANALSNACASAAIGSQRASADVPVPTVAPVVTPGAGPCLIGDVCAPEADPGLDTQTEHVGQTILAASPFAYVEATAACGILPECRVEI